MPFVVPPQFVAASRSRPRQAQVRAASRPVCRRAPSRCNGRVPGQIYSRGHRRWRRLSAGGSGGYFGGNRRWAIWLVPRASQLWPVLWREPQLPYCFSVVADRLIDDECTAEDCQFTRQLVCYVSLEHWRWYRLGDQSAHKVVRESSTMPIPSPRELPPAPPSRLIVCYDDYDRSPRRYEAVKGGDTMAGFPPISVRQPLAFDLVDDPVDVCGVGTGFEGVLSARLRDANGVQLAQASFSASGTGTWGNFQVALPIGIVPATPQGTLEVFESSAKDGSDLNTVVVPITFGRALIDPYHGFAQYTVVPGNTLSAIALQWYGDATKWPRIFEANRHQIANPNLIFPGQVLRIPQ